VTEDEKIQRVARAAHNTVVTYCKTHGDYSIKEWEDAENWQRESTIAMVRNTLSGNFSPSQEHERWLHEKRSKGYVYGDVKNDDASKGPLTNPNIRPYKELPLVQRMKDTILIAVTLGAAAHYGLPIAKELEVAFA
jgi:hypothetical protein